MPCSHIRPSDTTGSKFASHFVFHVRQSTTISGCLLIRRIRCQIMQLAHVLAFLALFLVACYATLHPALSVHQSVRPLVRPFVRHTLLFLGFCGFWPHCSCPNDGVTSIMAPAHPHATGVAVYPALFSFRQF